MLQGRRKALICQFRMTFLYDLSSYMVNLQRDIVTKERQTPIPHVLINHVNHRPQLTPAWSTAIITRTPIGERGFGQES